MKTILVVDDSKDLVEVLSHMLERGGYRTIAAYSGKECLDILKDVHPDLIILDIMMVAMDGWETLRRIKNNTETKDIPVLMLTAKQLTSEVAQKYRIYIEDYILKPITMSELYNTISQVHRAKISLTCP